MKHMEYDALGETRTLDKPENKEEFLSTIRPVLMNTYWNTAELTGIVHRECMDLSIAYKSVADSNERFQTFQWVDADKCALYGVHEDELFEAAFRNVIKDALVLSMEQMMKMLTGDTDCDELDLDTKDGTGMVVVTNKQRFKGAALMFAPGLMKMIADRCGGDLYVFPSSVHEVLTLPYHKAAIPKNMTREINEQEVDPDERLSNNIYVYHRDTDSFEILM